MVEHYLAKVGVRVRASSPAVTPPLMVGTPRSEGRRPLLGKYDAQRGDPKQPRDGRQLLAGGECSRLEPLAKFLDPDYVWEMPQSGERVRGVTSNREMNDNYPAGLPDIQTHRVTGSEDRWVTTPSWTVLKITGTGDDYISEFRVSYPDGSVWPRSISSIFVMAVGPRSPTSHLRSRLQSGGRAGWSALRGPTRFAIRDPSGQVDRFGLCVDGHYVLPWGPAEGTS